MFRSILRKCVWERRKSTLFWCFGVGAYTFFIGVLYPSIDGIEGFQASVDDMPDPLKALLGEVEDITSPTGFLAAEVYNLVLPLLLSVLAIGYGASAIAREEEPGTLELLLATANPRWRIVLEKLAALTLILLAVTIAAWAGIAAAMIVVDFDVSLDAVWWATLMAAMLALAFGVIALLVTAWGGSRGLAIGAATGLFVVSYFANTVVLFVGDLEDLRYASLLYYYDGEGVLQEETRLSHVLVLLGVVVTAAILSWFGFGRRDTGL